MVLALPLLLAFCMELLSTPSGIFILAIKIIISYARFFPLAWFPHSWAVGPLEEVMASGLLLY